MKVVGDFKHWNYDFYDNRDNPSYYEVDCPPDIIRDELGFTIFSKICISVGIPELDEIGTRFAWKNSWVEGLSIREKFSYGWKE